jgi:hypothetical protein
VVVNYPEEHLLITVQGTSWANTETWQFGVRALAVAVVPTDAQCQNIANTLAAPTQALFTSPALFMTQDNVLTAIKVARIGRDGKYPVDHAPGIYLYAPPVASAGGTRGIPQATMCVTLLTNVPRGRASHGRFFLPPTAIPVSADGRITVAQADAMEAACRTWLLAINAVAEVVSVRVYSGLGAGRASDVQSVGVGRVVDTMRSRRRNLVEGRTPLPL